MTLALRSPGKVADIVPIDNAPVDAALTSDFPKYTQGMRKVEEAGVTKLSEADKILADYAPVCHTFFKPLCAGVLMLTMAPEL